MICFIISLGGVILIRIVIRVRSSIVLVQSAFLIITLLRDLWLFLLFLIRQLLLLMRLFSDTQLSVDGRGQGSNGRMMRSIAADTCSSNWAVRVLLLLLLIFDFRLISILVVGVRLILIGVVVRVGGRIVHIETTFGVVA